MVTVTAQGTVFQCDLISASAARVVVFEGVVNVSMGEQSVELKAGQMLEAHLGQPLVASGSTATAPAEQSPSAPAARATATWTDQQKTLFPPVLTPTRPGDNVRLYTVQPGDTLYSIARKFNTSWEAIYEANRNVLSSPEKIRAGQELRIP